MVVVVVVVVVMVMVMVAVVVTLGASEWGEWTDDGWINTRWDSEWVDDENLFASPPPTPGKTRSEWAAAGNGQRATNVARARV